jgi:elongation factor 1-beta
MSFASIAELNNFLLTRSYVEGYSFSAKDVEALRKFGIPDRASFPHAYRWAIHIAALVGVANISAGPAPSSGAKAAATPAAKPAAKAAAADDMDDIFGCLDAIFFIALNIL